MQSTSERVLFVHAHPDDESITTGGTIATLVDRGASVTVVTCTRGELGEVIPADLKHLEGTADLLAVERTAELERAMAALGVADHRFLGADNARWPDLAPRRYTDSGMAWGASGPEPLAAQAEDSFCAAEFGEIAADIAAVIDLVRPNAVVSYDENGGYGHPDHIRAHQAARRAAAVMAVPFFVVDEDPAHSTLRVDVHSVLSRKREALRSHRTQVVVEGDRFALSSGPSRPIAAVEGFSRRPEAEPEAPAWKDQGFGVHIMTYLFALVVGAVIGGISVVNHQFSPQIDGRPIPVGITIVLLIVAALFAGLRIVFPGRLVVGCAALGLLGVILLLALPNDGGSVLVPANVAGYLLTFGSAVLALIALSWPAAGTFSRDRLVTKL